MIETYEREKWEYRTRTVALPVEPDVANLDGLGDEGWQLVSAVSFGDDQCELFFRRMKVEKKARSGVGFGR